MITGEERLLVAELYLRHIGEKDRQTSGLIFSKRDVRLTIVERSACLPAVDYWILRRVAGGLLFQIVCDKRTHRMQLAIGLHEPRLRTRLHQFQYLRGAARDISVTVFTVFTVFIDGPPIHACFSFWRNGWQLTAVSSGSSGMSWPPPLWT